MQACSDMISCQRVCINCLIDSGDNVLSDCPSGYSPHGGSCYQFVTTPADWYTARDNCANSGGYLAKITDAAEQRLAVSLTGYVLLTYLKLFFFKDEAKSHWNENIFWWKQKQQKILLLKAQKNLLYWKPHQKCVAVLILVVIHKKNRI